MKVLVKDKFKIALVNYGMGNTNSIKNALLHVDDKIEINVTDSKQIISNANCIILPGVGAFPDAMNRLNVIGLKEFLTEQVIAKGKPTLGICLGMQLLFTSSIEGGFNYGLNWISGHVEHMKDGTQLNNNYRIPHVGWNDLQIKRDNMMFDALGEDKNFYFVHSYHAVCEEKYVTATFEYGHNFVAAVQRNNIMGMQFHPEKSQHNGMSVLKQFINWAKGL